MMLTSSPNPIVCFDANLVIRLVTDHQAIEVRRNFAEVIAEGAIILVPTLYRYEVTNAIHRLARSRGLSNEHAMLLLDEALNVPVQIRDVPLLHHRAFTLSREFDLPASYDAHYLALAESLGCGFFTSDAKLFRAVTAELKWVNLVQ